MNAARQMKRYLARGSMFVLEELLLANGYTMTPEQCFAVAEALGSRLDSLIAGARPGTRGVDLLDRAVDAAIEIAARLLNLEIVAPTKH